MKKCFSCDTECLPEAKFCQQCGRGFGPRADVKRRAAPVPGYPHQESLSAFDALRRRKTRNACIAAAVVFFFSCGAALAWGPYVLFIGAFAAVVAGLVAITVRPADYYSLPHSRDAAGEHRCIFCGNRGIWRQGAYKSNAVSNNCSRCKETLFVD